ncbi:MAG TPA: hypothetical protein VJH03_22155 [Blastocatellia bacterium]|nr:hypothetical protein [Blastocatellia bacterium]
MNRIILGLLFALAVAPASGPVTGKQVAQRTCGMTATSSPAVRGVRLAMSLEQVVALFPGVNKRKETRASLEPAKTAAASETVYLAFEPAIDSTGDQFAGVSTVAVGLRNGRVVDFSVQYVGPTWRTIDEWVEKLSETLKLPKAKRWAAGPNESPNRVLKCDGIEIEAAIQGGGASIRIRDTEHQSDEEALVKAEKKQRREFKP